MKLTFLSYCPRSGSTKLAQMLSEEAVVLPEFRSAIWLIERTPSSHRYARSEILDIVGADPQLRDNLGFTDTDIAALADRGTGHSGQDIVRDIVRSWCRLQALREPETALVKVGRMVEVADELMRSDPDTAVLFLVRDPRAVILSMATTVVPRDPSAGTFSRGSNTYSVRLWRKRLHTFRQLQSDFADRCLMVRFEDLDNRVVLDDVIDFVGQADVAAELAISSIEQSLHPNVASEFDRGHNDKWRGRLGARTVRRTEVMCRSEMRDLGYELDDPSAPNTIERVGSAIASAASIPRAMFHRGRTVLAGRYR